MNILLASSSFYRRELMDRLQIPYIHQSPQVDEGILKTQFKGSLKDLPLFLAQKKAESLIDLYPDHLIIGSDQMGLLENQKLDKPGSFEKAVTELEKLQGKTHELITAIAVYHEGRWHNENVITHLHMKPLSRPELESYVQADQPLDCAGSYKIEKKGILLFEKIDAEDPTAIIGLPLMALARAFEEFGFKYF